MYQGNKQANLFYPSGVLMSVSYLEMTVFSSSNYNNKKISSLGRAWATNDHRITEGVSLKVTTVGSPGPESVTQSIQLRTVSMQSLNICNEGHSTTFLSSLFHSHTHSTEVLAIIQMEPPCASVCPCSLLSCCSACQEPGSIFLTPTLQKHRF